MNIDGNSDILLISGKLINTDNGRFIIEAAETQTVQIHLHSVDLFLSNEQSGIIALHQKMNIKKIGINRAWAIPRGNYSENAKVYEFIFDSRLVVDYQAGEAILSFNNQNIQICKHNMWPFCDFSGNDFLMASLVSDEYPKLTNVMAGFYWHTLIPSVIEFSSAENFPLSTGYVLSTLESGAYPGTYPTVDHEFQIKGRLAMGSVEDIALVRRMIELQLQLMAEDPIHLYRNPCSLQPDGKREYYVRRSSQDGSQNAVMFMLTGNIEILEEAWLYYAATKDISWLDNNIEALENSAALIQYNLDSYFRLWSDVFYEDQVIKDGRECISACFAAKNLLLLSELESKLERFDQAKYYNNLSLQIATTLVKAKDFGFWDDEKKRFIDWVDKMGNTHDHVHLLANILPVLFGYADNQQKNAILALMDKYENSFQLFPTFVAVNIADYNKSEIGSGGPYDLCAAGRYWCWDAAFLADQGKAELLLKQLQKVAEQAGIDSFEMGERYDMNHVYYIDDKNWHGAAHYYEYPCVYIWVLIVEMLGFRFDLENDIYLRPCLHEFLFCRLTQSLWQIEYEWTKKGFRIKNLASQTRKIRLDLSKLYHEFQEIKFHCESNTGSAYGMKNDSVLILKQGEECNITICKRTNY